EGGLDEPPGGARAEPPDADEKTDEDRQRHRDEHRGEGERSPLPVAGNDHVEERHGAAYRKPPAARHETEARAAEDDRSPGNPQEPGPDQGEGPAQGPGNGTEEFAEMSREPRHRGRYPVGHGYDGIGRRWRGYRRRLEQQQGGDNGDSDQPCQPRK